MLNVKKCNFIVFKSKKNKLKSNLNISLNNKKIQRVDKTKFLGLIIDQNLTWKHHSGHITKKSLKLWVSFAGFAFMFINHN